MTSSRRKHKQGTQVQFVTAKARLMQRAVQHVSRFFLAAKSLSVEEIRPRRAANPAPCFSSVGSTFVSNLDCIFIVRLAMT
jgi:hypothetical protein